MPIVKYKLVSDPTFNDYLGTLQFKFGICEVNTDSEKEMKRIVDLGMIGFQIEPLEGLPVEEKKASVKRTKRKKKRKRKRKAFTPKLVVSGIITEVSPGKEMNDPLEKLPEFDNTETTGEQIEQTENKPEHDGEGRSGDDREDDPFSQADSQ